MGEWAQLRAGQTTRSGLERGVWYLVRARGNDGRVLVQGPNAVPYPMLEAAVRIVDREPDRVTRVQQVEFFTVKPGESAKGPAYYGVCPQGHWIREVQSTDTEARCGTCGRTYGVEDEQNF